MGPGRVSSTTEGWCPEWRCGEWVRCRPVASPGGACGATFSLILPFGGACGAAILYSPSIPHIFFYRGACGAALCPKIPLGAATATAAAPPPPLPPPPPHQQQQQQQQQQQ
eukprot:gene5397-biopygen23708